MFWTACFIACWRPLLVLGRATNEEKEYETEIGQLYLHSCSDNIKSYLTMVRKAGLCSLHIIQLVYPERFELLEIKYRLEEFRNARNNSYLSGTHHL